MATTERTAAPPADCLACRLIGTGAFALLGLYAIGSARYYALNKALAVSRAGTVGMRLTGYGFLGAAAYRWTVPMQESQKFQNNVP
ncbi:hypothetical protein P389DRAFT_193963 [Cystobasidium minutum MCA 4210]|uniref:uncharacterized protein n=1 Tax=Cystobasidium minutum MCA 4210 TaxID=1397322 RepID=UPI0034CFB856|eukprot:jgi/Rhomi1/193963/gm1.2177_g